MVIGSGISGLCAALIMARHGRRVALLEQSPRLAPLLSRFERNGFWFDSGYHYHGNMFPGSALESFFRSMGLDELVDRAIPMNPDGFDRITLDDGLSFALPQGVERVEERLCEAFPEDARAIPAYIERMQKILECSPFTNRQASPNRSDFRVRNESSFRTFLEECGLSRRFIEAMGTYGFFLYGVWPEETPIHLHAQVVGSFFQSAHTYPEGGDTIVRAFRRRLDEAGVDIFLNAPVVEIMSDEERRVKSVTFQPSPGESELIECSNCVCTIHPENLAAILKGERIRPAHLNRLRGFSETFSPFALYLEVDDPPESVQGSNNYFINLREIDRERSLAVLNCAPATNGGEKSGICVLGRAWDNDEGGICPGRHRHPCRAMREKSNAAYQSLKDKMTESHLAWALEAMPELKGRVRLADAAMPCTFETYTRNRRGSIYGIRHSIGNASLSAASSVRGLYLAGQNVVAPGVMGSAISAFLSAAMVVGWDSYWTEVGKHR